MRILDYLDILE